MSAEPCPRQDFVQYGLIGSAPGMAPLLQRAIKGAQVGDATLLIEGETGTGKQVLAAAIHAMDPKRSNGPFVTVHCGTIPDSLTESELFGHRKGAFSGAVAERKGLFAAANGGTIFLDDINDLPVSTQPKLLDVLQRSCIRPVGSDRESMIDVRVIPASNCTLKPLVDEGRFRADLYYRLDGIHLRIPSLRERLDDLEALMLGLAARHSHLYQPIRSVSRALPAPLRTYEFPGNVRELEHIVQRMLFGKISGEELGLEDLEQDWDAGTVGSQDLKTIAAQLLPHIENTAGGSRTVLAKLQNEMLQAALASSTRTRRETARMFRISERCLYQRIRALKACS